MINRIEIHKNQLEEIMTAHPKIFGGLVSNGRPSLHAQAAATADANGNSFTAVPTGTVKREGNPWDVSTPWSGRELTGYMTRRSLWSKDVVVSFYWLDNENRRHTEFTLHLEHKLSENEAHRAADSFMMMLNMARAQ